LGDGDAGGFLASVLEREEAEVRKARDVALGCVDAEDAAHQRTCPIWTNPREPSRDTRLGAQARMAAPAPGSYSAGSSTSAWRPSLHAAASASADSMPPPPTSW